MTQRTRQRKVLRRQKTPLVGKFLRRRLGLEQICDRCSKPFPTSPQARPVEQFVFGSTVASVFAEHSFGRTRYHVQFGRYAANGREMFIAQMLQDEHLADIAEVAMAARQYINEQQRSKRSSRR